MLSTTILIFFLTILVNIAICRDFYVGMFKKNDLLVAQDRLFKPRQPYRIQYAKYGRIFKCPITYFRVVDRLGYGRGPKTDIIRGGLQKRYIVLRFSAYNSPISVNIYVGCENKMKIVKNMTVLTTNAMSDSDGNGTTVAGGNDTATGAPGTGGTGDGAATTGAGEEAPAEDAAPPEE